MAARPGAVRQADAVYDHALRTGGTVTEAWRAVREGQHQICFVTAGDDPEADVAAMATAGTSAAPLTWPHLLDASGIGNALAQLAGRDAQSVQQSVRLDLRPKQDTAAVLRAFQVAATTSAKVGDTRGAWQAVVELYDHQHTLLVRYVPAAVDQPPRFEFPLTATTQLGKALRDFVRGRAEPLGAAYSAERIEILLAVECSALREHARQQLQEAATAVLEQCCAAGCQNVVIRDATATMTALRDGRMVGPSGAPVVVETAVSAVPPPTTPSASPASLDRQRMEIARLLDANDPPWPVPTRLPVPLTARERWLAYGEPEEFTVPQAATSVAAVVGTITARARTATRPLKIVFPCVSTQALQILLLVKSPVPILIQDGSKVEYCRYPDRGDVLGGIDVADIGEHLHLTILAIEALATTKTAELLQLFPLSITLTPSLLAPTRAQQEWAEAMVARLALAGWGRVVVRTDAGQVLAAGYHPIAMPAAFWPEPLFQRVDPVDPVVDAGDAILVDGERIGIEALRRLVAAPARPIEVYYTDPEFPSEVAAMFPELEAALSDDGDVLVSFSTPVRQVAFGRSAIIQRYATLAWVVLDAVGVKLSAPEAVRVAESCLTNFGIESLSARGRELYFQGVRGSVAQLQQQRRDFGFAVPSFAALAGALREAYYALRFGDGRSARELSVTLDLTAVSYGLFPHVHHNDPDKRFPAFERALSNPQPSAVPPVGLLSLLEQFPRLLQLAARTLQGTWQLLLQEAIVDPPKYVRRFAGRVSRRGTIALDNPSAADEAIRIALLALALQEIPNATARQVARAYRAVSVIAVPQQSTPAELARPLRAAHHPWHAAWAVARAVLTEPSSSGARGLYLSGVLIRADLDPVTAALLDQLLPPPALRRKG
ncbi:MAG: hypothetical protein HY696_02450 [Deltaproteobacteria bacterium]|nr:hypothetical protein [Deltaproteobacteria bacterium]